MVYDHTDEWNESNDEVRECPAAPVQSVIVIGRPSGACSSGDIGWQPLQETIRKSDKDTRQYQAIRLDNDMVVLLVSDPQAKVTFVLVVPVDRLKILRLIRGLLSEHMCLMGSKISAGG